MPATPPTTPLDERGIGAPGTFFDAGTAPDDDAAPVTGYARKMHMDAPRGLQDPDELAERHRMLAESPALSPLRDWADAMMTRRGRRQTDLVLPLVDPADAAVNAKTLILLDAPGTLAPDSLDAPGSGFASVDNDDPIAESLWNLRNDIAFDDVMVWNIVPWYLSAGRKKPNAPEVAQGAMELRALLPLLKNLRVVVLCGPHAQDGWWKHVEPLLGNTYSAFNAPHPSPLSLKQPGRREEIEKVFARAKQVAG